MTMKLKRIFIFCVVLFMSISGLTYNAKAIDSQNNENQEIGEETANDETQHEVNKQASVILSALSNETEVGLFANYQLYFRVNGQNNVYEKLQLVVQLPQIIDGYDVAFTQDLNELIVNGVLPVYDAITKTLTYNFENCSGGFEASPIIKLATRNGAVLNDVELELSAQVIENGVVVDNASASTTLKAQLNASVSNTFLGIIKDDELVESSNTYRDINNRYGIGLSVNRFDSGSIDLDETSVVTLQYILPNGMHYVSDTSGVVPTIIGNTIEWKFNISENNDGQYHFLKNFELELHTDSNIAYFAKLQTKASANFVFSDGTASDFSSNATVMLAPNDFEEFEGLYDGQGYASIFSGPADGIGTTG